MHADPGDPSSKSDYRPTDWRASLREAGPYLGLGMQLALTMAFFTLGGYLLDRWLDTVPWLTIGGALVGMAAVFIQLVRVSTSASRTSRKPEDPPETPGNVPGA
jgi:ATP synthase protein I